MPLVETQDLLNYRNNPNRNYGCDFNGSTEKEAECWLKDKLELALSNNQRCKSNRPWNIVNFTALLPKDQPWIGFEYETGFDDKKDYQRAINWLWDNVKYVAFDREGSGNYPVEIAFPPTTAKEFENNTAPLQRYLAWLKKQNMKQANNPTTYTRRAIGMHVNISSPKWRAAGAGKRADGGVLSAWLKKLDKAQHEELFGRYQTFWSWAVNRANWIEFKLFKSTDDVDKVAGYCRVSLRLAELLEWSVDNYGVTPVNLYEFLRGDTNDLKTPITKKEETNVRPSRNKA